MGIRIASRALAVNLFYADACKAVSVSDGTRDEAREEGNLPKWFEFTYSGSLGKLAKVTKFDYGTPNCNIYHLSTRTQYRLGLGSGKYPENMFPKISRKFKITPGNVRDFEFPGPIPRLDAKWDYFRAGRRRWTLSLFIFCAKTLKTLQKSLTLFCRQ